SQALRNLLGIAGRVGGRAEGFQGQLRRGLVMLAPTVTAAEEPRDDVGPQRPDMADIVADDLVTPPLLDRFLDAEREAEVDRPREELLCAVEAMHGQQLLGAEDAERLEQLRPDLVLPAVAAGRRHEYGSHALSLTEHRQQAVVLVVRVSTRPHAHADARRDSQL